MKLATFFFITWLICALFAVIKKRLSLIENTFIFLVVLVLSINFSWIIIEELKWAHLTKSGLEYCAYLLNRSIITPMVFVLQFNLLKRSGSRLASAFIVALSIVFLTGMNLLSSFWHITTYKKWNVGWEVVYLVLLNLIVYLIYKGFKKLSYNRVDMHDSV